MRCLAPSLDDVTHERGRMFRAFADQTKSDRQALAACIRGSRDLVDRSDMGKIDVPTLIGVGTKDDIAGSPQELAALMPDARSARYSRPRPHAGGRRPGLQGGGAGILREVSPADDRWPVGKTHAIPK